MEKCDKNSNSEKRARREKNIKSRKMSFFLKRQPVNPWNQKKSVCTNNMTNKNSNNKERNNIISR